ncbi:MAG: hypothetical protein SV760_08945, partial [Halobacteria archaeon]|nr:hypothetical protein [Halobacteria archaeon]
LGIPNVGIYDRMKVGLLDLGLSEHYEMTVRVATTTITVITRVRFENPTVFILYVEGAVEGGGNRVEGGS